MAKCPECAFAAGVFPKYYSSLYAIVHTSTTLRTIMENEGNGEKGQRNWANGTCYQKFMYCTIKCMHDSIQCSRFIKFTLNAFWIS